MRLRLAAAIVALYVFTSAVMAYAECAWVLWDGQLSTVSGTAWSINGTYSTAKDCNSDLADYVAAKKRRGDEVSDPRSGTALYSRGDIRGYLHCLPDTVDPRGAKGK